MSVIAVASNRTSPGATTLAAGLAVAWSHRCKQSLLIEADPSGGVLSLRFGLAAAPTLATFGSDIRNEYSPDLVWANTQDMRGVRCMPAPVDPRLARSWSERLAPVLSKNLPTIGAPVVVDLGWVGENDTALAVAEAADTTLVVTAPHAAEVQALLFQIRQLKNAGANVALVVVGDQPNDPHEIASIAGVPLAAVLPSDKTAAAALGGAKFAPKKFRRSLLWRTMSGLADSLLDEQLMISRAPDLAPAHDPAESSGAPDAPSGPAADAAVPPPPPPLDPPVEAPMHFEPASSAQASSAQALNIVSSPAPEPDRGNPATLTGTFRSTESKVMVRTPVPVIFSPPVVPAAPSVDTDRPWDTVPTAVELVLPDGERHPLVNGEAITIGRHSSCDVVVLDAQISRHHGTLTYTDQGWTYVDNGSRNGSVVNGQRRSSVVLNLDDELVLGKTRISLKPRATSLEVAG